VVVRRLETAGKWRSDERERVADERRERVRDYATVCTVGSRMKRSDDCDWLDLQVDRTVWMSGSLIWCGAVHRKIGTPDDVAQRDQILEYFKG